MDDEECFPRGKPKQKLKQKRSKVEDVSDSEVSVEQNARSAVILIQIYMDFMHQLSYPFV